MSASRLRLGAVTSSIQAKIFKKCEGCGGHLVNTRKFKTFGTINVAAKIDSAVKIYIKIQ